MALTCLCAMTSSFSPQTVRGARAKSGEIPPEGFIHPRGPRSFRPVHHGGFLKRSDLHNWYLRAAVAARPMTRVAGPLT